MPMELQGSRTQANLMAAFSGESMARTKYDLFAGAAKKEGYVHIANVFYETANNEREHAKIWFKMLQKLNGTEENLGEARDGERYEWSEMYAKFEREAREEGFDRIAALFKLVASVEKHHDQRYQALLNDIRQNRVFRRDKPIRWLCTNCGYIHEGLEAPAQCPLCAHPQSYFMAYDASAGRAGA